jgi:hypothetical protein
MSLDSWIDDRALHMLRALAPSRASEVPAEEPAADFGFDPLPGKEESLPESGEAARIAPPVEPDAAAVQRLRNRLAEIRRRAEAGGVVRGAPAQITPAVPVAPAPPSPEEPMVNPPESVLMVRRRPAGLIIPGGPLALRLEAYRHWLEQECGLANPVVFDRHGCPLHPAEGQASFIAAAVALGLAGRETGAVTDPPEAPPPAYSAWGTGLMVVIPVRTRFGDLYVAGQIEADIEPDLAAEIGSALLRTAGV